MPRRRRALWPAALLVPVVVSGGVLATGLAPAQAAPTTGAALVWGEQSAAPPASATSDVIDVAQGTYSTYAAKSDGSVVGWISETGALLPDLGASNVVSIDAGSGGYPNARLIGLRSDGSVVQWNGNAVPPEAATGVSAVDSGQVHSLALKAGGVIAWGGNPSQYPERTQVPAAATSGVIGISGGWYHSLAVKADGSVVAWGDHDKAQYWQVPTEASSDVTAVSAGYYHSLALKRDGSVVAWGQNVHGETDVPEAAKSGVVAIVAGYQTSIALKADGSVIVWGDNSQGTLDVPAAAQAGVTTIDAYKRKVAAVRSTSAPTFTAFVPPMETVQNQPYSYQFAATGYPAPQFALADGAFPTGLSIDAATGLLAGTPSQTGDYRFKIRASNGIGTDAVTGWLAVKVITAPVFTAQTPPTGKVGSTYSYTFAASGYPAPTFAIASGAPPAGLTLNAATGKLSGTTGKAGQSTFTVRAANGSASSVETAPVTVTVNPSPQTGKAVVADAPASVVPGAWEDSDTIRVMPERYNQVLAAPLTVGGTTVPAGTKVNVYYLHADPVGSQNVASQFAASVWFGTPILAIASSTSDLANTVANLGHVGTAYPTSTDQGLEYDDAVSVNGTTVNVAWNVYNSSDAIRIITLAP